MAAENQGESIDNQPFPPVQDADGHINEVTFVDLELPPTEPNVWDEVMRFRQHAVLQPTQSNSCRTASGTAEGTTTIGSEDLESLDSFETLSDRYFGVDPSKHGLTPDVLLREEFLVDLACNSTYYYLLYEQDAKNTLQLSKILSLRISKT